MNLRLPIRKVQDLKNIITLIALLVKKLAPDEKIQDIMLFDVAKENTYIATYRPEFTHENRTIKFELKPNK